jgi:hypothetical protein
VTRALAISLVALLVLGCGSFEAPAPTPGSMDDVIAELVLHGASVHNPVSGDAGCPSSELHDNALRFDMALGRQSVTREVYLLRWRRQSDFDAGAKPFEDCVSEYRALHPNVQVTTLDLYPWRAYGPSWSPQVGQVLSDALAASGGGQP